MKEIVILCRIVYKCKIHCFYGGIVLIDTIKSLTIIVPAIIIYIKTVHSLFIEIIKFKYKKSAGEESIFNIVLSIIGYAILAVEIVFFFLFIISILKGNKTYNPIVLLNINPTISDIMGIIIVLIFLFMVYSVIVNFARLIDSFRFKLENGAIDDMKKFYKRRINLNAFLILFLLCVFFVPFISVGYEVIKEKNFSITLYFIIGFIITMATVLHSLYKTWKDIYDERIYVLEGDGIFITCKLYLTYSDYFLIISEKEEKFISKSKIGIIRKIKILNEEQK